CLLFVHPITGASGPPTPTVTFTSNAANSSQTFTLGNETDVEGPYLATLAEDALFFAHTFVGTATGPRKITVTNVGTEPATISQILILGYTSTYDFSQTNNCSTLAPAASCTIGVTFALLTP